MRSLIALTALLLLPSALADGPSDNIPAKVRPVPKPGIDVPADERKSLEDGLTKLSERIQTIERHGEVKQRRYVADVRIFHKAVHDALIHNEFFDTKEFTKAHALIDQGMKRAEALLGPGEPPWTTQTGLVVLGYTSKIDGSVQPYGLVVPESFQPKGPFRHRLDLWFHGRGELLSEVNFLDERQRSRGEFTPEDTFVLHPYGRYCNAFKFAGEVDVLEALADAKTRYRIDEDRISARGFSMGGAAAWQFAVHYPSLWFAANPGAGFSETPRFLKVFQNEKLEPTWYERSLWQMYDCTDWAANLSNCPTVAYSGELDPQKQAADVMDEALKGQLTHVIGPKTKHQYEPGAKAEVARRMDLLAVRGRDRSPRSITFTTPTLRYNQSSWLRIDGLEEHWKPASISAKWVSDNQIEVSPGDVTAFSLEFDSGALPAVVNQSVRINIVIGVDFEEELVCSPQSDRSMKASFHKDAGTWRWGPVPSKGLRKQHGLQGPIDDAFMDAFVFVKPTGESKNTKVAEWVKSESERAVKRWRTQFRGDARVKEDKDLTDAEISGMNLVLWGDPQSNSVLAKIADRLPIRWEGDSVVVGDERFLASEHIPILIFPNPLNPEKYVVLNSGFTYREYDDLNNARQVPKLPDWAIIDVKTPPDSRLPGKVVAADFFDESWKLKPKAKD